MKLLRVLHSKIREAAKSGNTLALAVTGEKPRSPHWETVRKGAIARNAGAGCEACGDKRGLQVHHVEAFHDHPELELADGTGRYCQLKNSDGKFKNNLIVLGESLLGCECHLKLGHGGNFHTNNPRVRLDAAEMRHYPDRRKALYARAASQAVGHIA